MVIDRFDDEYAFLSNFFESPVWHNGILWPTVEHAYQAAKVDKETAKKIQEAKTPGQAKRLGRQGLMKSNWAATREGVMRKCLQWKFLCNPELLAKLLATGEADLIEGNNWHDNFWGVCNCEKCSEIPGNNALGRLLMEIRDKYLDHRYIYAVQTKAGGVNFDIKKQKYEIKQGLELKEYFKRYEDAVEYLSTQYDYGVTHKHCDVDDNHIIIIELK